MELFVISPYFDADTLLSSVSRRVGRNVVVSSGLLLPSEQARLAAADPMIALHGLSDGFTDAELGHMDDVITTDIDALARESDAADLVNLAYPELFMRAVSRRRNRVAATRIRTRYGPAATLWICAGPNITAASWAMTFPEAILRELPPVSFAVEEASKPAPVAEKPAARGVYATNSPASLARTRLFSASEGNLLLDLSGVRATLRPRRLARAAHLARVVPALWKLRRAQQRLRRRLRLEACDLDLTPLRPICETAALRFVTSEIETMVAARRRGARAVVAALHAFRPEEALAARITGLPVIVAQDGYLPINYPLAVYGVYRGARFLWWSEASRRWGARVGLEGVECQPYFPSPAQSPSDSASGAGPRILAMPNHGGEWTSLIFRSDIDRFVAGIVATARLRPDVTFRIRTHPTMGLEAHDGVNAADRLKRFVAESDVANVSFSTSALEADIAWATFAVSEYSLTLLEFVTRNRGGIATFNPTGRRDFFSEFTARGVPHATDAAQLASLVDRQPTEGSDVIRTMMRPAPSSVAEALGALTKTDAGSKTA
jgi:hypothetical protein